MFHLRVSLLSFTNTAHEAPDFRASVQAGLRRLGALVATGCFALGAQAASVGAGGYTADFGTQPSAADWSTYSVSGGSGDITSLPGLDTPVQTLAAASINGQVGADAANPPAANALAYWSSSGLYLQTRPTGNQATVLMCTLVNNIGAEAGAVSLSYDALKTDTVTEEAIGQRAYYSLSGAANSWTVIPEFSAGTDGRLTANLTLRWPSGGTLYVLWADDNGSGTPDTSVRIDNFAVTATSSAQVPVAITNQPLSQVVDELKPVTFAVGTTGNPVPTFQWYRNNLPISGATNATYTIAAAPFSDHNATFYVIAANVVSNVTYTATSSAATLTVNADLVKPVLLVAFASGQHQVVASFSERLAATSVTNPANYVLTGPGASIIISNATLDVTQTNVVLEVSTMTVGTTYTLTVNGLTDQSAAANVIAPNSQAQFTVTTLSPANIGNPPLQGTATDVTGGYDITGGGTNLAGAADQFFFFHQPAAGAFDFKVRLEGISLSDAWAKAGLMAREDLNAGSRFAMAVATPSVNGAYFLSRATVNAASIATGQFPVNYPQTWLRLARAGNVFTGYASLDGQNWMQLGSVTLSSAASTFYVGLAVCGGTTNGLGGANAAFREFSPVVGGSIVTGISLPWEPLGPATRNCGLVISEIMYHPKHSNDLEFIELFNADILGQDLTGWRLSGDADYAFPSNTFLPAGGFLVVARNPSLLEQAYGITGVLGPWLGAETNALPDASGTVRLRNPVDAVPLEVTYSGAPPWPLSADGAGHSLVLARPSYGQGEVKAWAASDHVGGSPGRMETVWPEAMRDVVVNEFFANSDVPDEDFIELYNHSAQPADISGAYLSDDRDTNKFRIPNNTVLPPRGFRSFTQTELGFGLSSTGERLYLVNSNQTRVIDLLAFDGQAPGVSSGRYPDGAAGFHELRTRTPGTTNSSLWIRDIVINELMFHPPTDDSDDEFVELFNRGTNTVDVSGWRFTDGITFTFPAGSVIPAGGFLVAAHSQARLLTNYSQLNTTNTVGDYSGSLANGGERLALSRPEYLVTTNLHGILITNVNWIVVDEVRYVDSGRWTRWADGGGSSLELIDPNSDNRLAPNWADSDETGKSEWTNVVTTALMDWPYPRNDDNGPSGALINEVQVMLLGAGEALMDDVLVQTNTLTTISPNFVTNPNFNIDRTGWTIQGNHVRSSLEPAGPNNPSQCLRLRATAGGDNGANRVECDLMAALQPNTVGTIGARFRWLCGFPIVLVRVHGGPLEVVGTLPLPPNLGTPGLPNSRRLTNAGPAIYDVAHRPVLPAANEPVVVTARLSDPDGLAAVKFVYRLDPGTALTTNLMRDDGTLGDTTAGDGLFSVTLSGQPAGTLVAFRLVAEDAQNPTGRTLFPPDAPTHEGLIRFGDPFVFGTLGVYRLWMTTLNYNTWRDRERLSNEPQDGTFVYGNVRAIYNAGARYRGSPFTRNPGSPLAVGANFVWSLPEDDLFLGTDELNIDSLEPTGRDSTALREVTAFTMAEQLGMPFSYQRFVRLAINGTITPSPVHTDTQQPNGEYVAMWFADAPDGDLYKVDDWFEFDDTPARQANKCANLGNFVSTNSVGVVSKKQARYRWCWEKKFNHGFLDDDYTSLYAVDNALNAPDATYVNAVEAAIDVQDWLTAFALRHIVGDWDGYGYNRGKNQFTYRPDGKKMHMLLWDLDFAIGCTSGHAPSQDLFSLSVSSEAGQNHMPEVQRLYNHPYFRRIYFQALLRIADGPLADASFAPALDGRYRALLANGVTGLTSPYVASGAQSLSLPAWIQQRRTYTYQQLLAQTNVAFSVTSSTTITAVSNSVTLTGNAPVSVKKIKVNGTEYAVTWTTTTAWSIRVPLATGTNLLAVQPYDLGGNLLSNSVVNATAVFAPAVPDPRGFLVFNELMFQPTVPGAEYVELFNTSSNFTFDLSGWRINGLSYMFPTGSFVGPRSFLLLVKDRHACLFAYGAAVPIFDEYNGNLQANGETLTLLKPGAAPELDLVIDKVHYGDARPWNTNAFGTGSSLQLLDVSQDNSRPANWSSGYLDPTFSDPITYEGHTNSGWRFVAVTGISPATPSQRLLMSLDGPGSVVLDDFSLVLGTNAAVGDNFLRNGDFELGSLLEVPAVTNSWLIPTWYTNTTLSTGLVYGGSGAMRMATTNVPSGLVSRLISQWLSPSTPTNTICTLSFWYFVTNNYANNGLYRGTNTAYYLANTTCTNLTVRVQNSGMSVITNISAVIDPPYYIPPLLVTPATPFRTPGALNTLATVLPAFPPLWLNEVQPVNLVGPTNHAGQHVPWLELYNAGTNAVPLDGLFLADNYTNLTQWAFPAGATIGAG
ncbi:MAG: lamin tail domain-containing protein, partial [Verrucomicrobia bacterium]|nr:lamin tail domain-containing protein [Verrucomicrobiota bacterium]